MINKKTTKKNLLFWTIGFFTALILIILSLFWLSTNHKPAFAQYSIEMPSITLTPIALGFTRPITITNANDGSGRLFIVEQAGRVIFLGPDLIKTEFLDIADRVLSPASGGGNEEGLLSIAFPPGFPQKPYFYVYYTKLNGNNVLSRFFLSPNHDFADPVSEEELLAFPHPQYTNHNGGQIAFGPDGYLYVGTGDGGGGGDPFSNAQNLSELKGKLLRIDVEMKPLPGRLDRRGKFSYWVSSCSSLAELNDLTYAIPDDNPFIDNPEFRSEIWAFGLRNPWRFSFDRKTGDLYIGDVGQENWEEIHFQPSGSLGGQNYGWNIMEGETCYNAATCDAAGLTLPVFTYPNAETPNCAVTGGYVYRGSANPKLEGIYIFGDFCSGSIFGLQKVGDSWVNGLLANTNYWISSFGEDEKGEVYLADMVGGGIYRVDQP